MAAILSNLAKLSLSQPTSTVFQSCRIHSQVNPLLIRATQQLLAEPMKKKKRIDPSVLAAKEAKKIKKIEKEIKKLTRFGRILKPVAEIELPNKQFRLAKERQRETPVLSFEESEERALLQKQWGRYRTKMWVHQYQVYDKLVAAQAEALEELKAESPELYQEAIKIDYNMIAMNFEGPKLTPPIRDYVPPDGDYVDTSRKY
ncbi:39S ribosomal protein l40, mitochondrial [Plakobranchus ocellatus]|uniref:Large ribosomal subunit protein mL40 n=1 Tax=Plakobranchus ocellatus TaxID=259542 RepID=A0AAV4AY74_9GAST|nr:39S ribosomal protein l40, mitochondrial [Plakobranchus ocellatus]